MDINPKIFGAYDIRGAYPEEVNEDIFCLLGKTFAGFLSEKGDLSKKEIIIGRDTRTSSKPLAESFIKGVLGAGFDVLDIGVCTTPMFYFSVSEIKAEGGAMITASHIPAKYNGIKLVASCAAPIGGEEMKDYFYKNREEKAAEEGKRSEIKMSEKYMERLVSGFSAKRDLKVVVDASGGTAGLFLPDFVRKFGIRAEPIFFETDPDFKKHDPNPLKEESQAFAREKILETKADFGVIFDADGDRIIVLDENGENIRADAIGGIIAEQILKKGNLALFGITSSKAVEEYFMDSGIKIERCKVGHFYVEKEMREKNADFSSENSGHYYFKSFNFSDSAFLAFRFILEALDKNPGKKISELARPFLKYNYSGEINVPLKKDKNWEELKKELEEKYGEGRRNFIDGITVEYGDIDKGGWWFNLRPSKTEPILRLMIETNSEEILEEKRAEILKYLE
ncbi:MAG: phosphomannomutase/phosphoglucomutase [Candidatus Pacebacteria bacterium]|nr:phosphomannomutase/phosphoglucomutase [Candidatus Paceibacterota bacterium]